MTMEQQPPLRYGSLFSGIEAATVAWHPLGFTPAWFAEIEPFPCAVLKHHYPHVPNLGDVTTVNWDAVEPVDLLVFGSPCQSFSVAGKRLGLDDPRGNLALYGLSVARKLRVRWLAFENVPGLLSSDEWRDFGAFLGLMGECGYHAAWRVLDAQYAGVPQRRRRVFVVGHLGDWRRAAAVLFERESLSGNPPPRRETGQRTAGTVARSVAIRGRDGTPQAELGDDQANAILTPNGGRGGIGVGAVLAETVGALCADSHPGAYSGQDAYTGRLVAATVDTSPGTRQRADASDNLIVAPQLARCVATREGSSQDWESTTMIAHSLTSGGRETGPHGALDGVNLVAQPLRAGRQYSDMGDGQANVVPTLTSQMQGASNQWAPHNEAAHLIPIAIRTAQTTANGHGIAEDVAHTLDGATGQAVAFDTGNQSVGAISQTLRNPNGIFGDGVPAVAGTLKAAENSGGWSNSADHAAAGYMVPTQAMAVRRLTPRECERLQGFPDDYTLIPYRGHDGDCAIYGDDLLAVCDCGNTLKPAADGPRYKALGNSMAVPVMRWIGARIALVSAVPAAAGVKR